ncbi:hypothetical protein A1O7_02599 [Cladophialophora yegresii CBS 114405]|uniref:DNA polymerase epsilon subunit D n=1 Tax=Cladophialophora yegresii CBS 114405 TaxID=1182544 RepID=W9WC76_9EURO|nr:uncharacterized protein A1O7_02599 [Cladophialophora yegresii CBS 114405]EXJ62166.1 hypothetical protein A1O7_02599 [Cladophialophora yegresii CBS 114405]
MPPRKSGASTAASAPDAVNGDVSMVSNATNAATTSPTQHVHAHTHPKQSRQSGGGGGSGKQQDDGVGIDDLLLPRSLISRLARGSLPPNTSLQKDALLALTRSATVFVSSLAHHANEQSQLRHRKTLGVQDVYVALQEMEMAGVMDLAAIGQDGRQGGRLEREVAAYEESVMKKRKGYREKVKARESAGGGGGEEDRDRGEPSSKKLRRTSHEEDEDEDERMLEQQLNGTAGVEVDAPNVNGRSEDDATSLSGLGNGKEKAITASRGQQDEDEDVGDGDADDAGDDGADGDGAGDEEDDQDDDETEDDEDENEDENDNAEDDDVADNDDVDDARLTNGRRRGLLPNGEVEIGSDEESD